jgi:hypothetical protein
MRCGLPNGGVANSHGAWSSQKEVGWLKIGYDMYWDCFVAIFGGVVGLKGAGHGGMDLKWAGHVGGVSLSHLGSKKFTRWYSVVLGGTRWFLA